MALPLSLPLILGSSSIFRRAVLTELGFVFEIVPPDIDEKALRHEDPKMLTLIISRAKAKAVMEKVGQRDVLIICSDQVIVCNGVIREKPTSNEECKEFLRSYRTYPALSVNSVVVVNTKTGKICEGTDVATQHFKYLPEELIDDLIENGDVMLCSGGFTIEHMGLYLGERIGEEETVRGLPKSLTLKLLKEVME